MRTPRSAASIACSAAVVVFACTGASADVAQTGQSGLVHMPDALLAPDGTWRVGASGMAPYRALWTSITLVPRVEVSGRFTRVADTVAFEGTRYGAIKDKAFDAKLTLVHGGGWVPSVAVGVQDFLGDSRLFPGEYLVTTQQLHTGAAGRFDVTAGYGRGRFDGGFGGVRWHVPGEAGWRLLAEWDGYDYASDFHALRTGEQVRRGGLTYAVEYARGWTTAQVSHQDGRWGGNLYVAFPLQQRTFIPRLDEPPPVPVGAAPAPFLAEWALAPESLQPLYRALAAEGISEVRMAVIDDHLALAFSERRMTMIGRAAGRAARLVALHAPPEARSLELTVTDFRLPLVTYRFDDLGLLRDYFVGEVGHDALLTTLSVSYADAGRHRGLEADGLAWTDVFGERPAAVSTGAGAPIFGLPLFMRRSGDRPWTVRFQPVRASFTFNDPNGVLRHELYSSLSYTQWLGSRTYANTSARVTLHENVSDTVGMSNSLLPRVRSDVGRYRREGGRARLQTAYLGHIANPTDRVYTWTSAGILEEMFAGGGGEVLYLPERGNWAVDASAYAVRQRDFSGGVGFRDYRTVTALVSHHYRVPKAGVTLTTRAGRFLARDLGARFELRRRFRSGFEVGGWYSVTDARDITTPGTPDRPYRDKGVFLRFALGPFLTHDNAAVVDFSLAPWTRDPAQRVHAPGGLYELFERRLLLNLAEFDPWSDFGF